jgi:hypothetical protein
LLFGPSDAACVFGSETERPRFRGLPNVERTGIEPVTSGLQSW